MVRPLNLYDWLLFLHVAGVFAVMSGQTVTTGIILAARGDPAGGRDLVQRLGRLSGLLFAAGGIAILVFGIWLVVHVDGYEFTEPWVLAGLGLWLVAAVAGSRAGALYGRAMAQGEAETPAAAGGRSERSLAVLLHAVSAAAVVIALLVMIFKPGVEL